jgi:hypothetical protein
MFFRPPYLGSSRIDEILDEAEREEQDETQQAEQLPSQERVSVGEAVDANGRAESKPSYVEGDAETGQVVAAHAHDVPYSAGSTDQDRAQTRIQRTVRTILGEDDLIPECKAMNLRLFEYFSQPAALRSLVMFAIGCEDDMEQKYAGMATEVLCSDVERLNDAFVSTDDVLTIFMSFVLRQPPLASSLTSNFAKIFLCMLRAKPEEMLSAIEERKTWFFTKGLLQHLEQSALSNLIIELLIQNEIIICRKVVHIYAEVELLHHLVDAFVDDTAALDDEKLSNITSIIIALSGRAVPLAEAPDIFQSLGGIPDNFEGGSILETAARANAQNQFRNTASVAAEDDSMDVRDDSATASTGERNDLDSLDLLRHPELVSRLLDACRQSDVHLLYGLSMVNELMSIYRELFNEYESVQLQWQQAVDKDSESSPSASGADRPHSPPYTAENQDASALGTLESQLTGPRHEQGEFVRGTRSIQTKMGAFERALRAHLPYLLSRLDGDGESGFFGMIRLKLAEFLVQMMQGVSPRLTRTLLEIGVPSKLTRLLHLYPWTSVFHQLYYRAIHETLIMPLQTFFQHTSEDRDEAYVFTTAETLSIKERLQAWFVDASLVKSFAQLQRLAQNAENGQLSTAEMCRLVQAIPQLECSSPTAKPPPPRIRPAFAAHLNEIMLEIYEQIFVPLMKAAVKQQRTAASEHVTGTAPSNRGQAHDAGTGFPGNISIEILQRVCIADDPVLALFGRVLSFATEDSAVLTEWVAFEEAVLGPIYEEKRKQRRQIGGRRPTTLSSHSLSDELAQLPTDDGAEADDDDPFGSSLSDRQVTASDGAVFQRGDRSSTEQREPMDTLYEDMDDDRNEFVSAPAFQGDAPDDPRSKLNQVSSENTTAAPELSVDDIMTGLSEGDQNSLMRFTDYLAQPARRVATTAAATPTTTSSGSKDDLSSLQANPQPQLHRDAASYLASPRPASKQLDSPPDSMEGHFWTLGTQLEEGSAPTSDEASAPTDANDSTWIAFSESQDDEPREWST